jgi:hypothetical protein
MDAQLRAQIAFHLTGKRTGRDLEAIDGLDLRPALFAGYRTLDALRYDFPVVLAADGVDASRVQSLSRLVDGALQAVAPRGPEGERLRRQVLRQEREIRILAGEGASGTLSALWKSAARRLAAATNEPLADSLEKARGALKEDGDVAACDAALPGRLLKHVWTAVQERKLRRLRDEVGKLALDLADVLKADFVRSEAGLAASKLKAAVGKAFEESFDFEALSQVLTRAAPAGTLPESRRKRIGWALSVLESQPFLKPPPDRGTGGGPLDGYVFDTCDAALAALRARLPAMIDLVKAIAIAQLESEGRYQEAEHDRLLAGFDENALGPGDLARLPDFLILLGTQAMSAAENAKLIEILSSGLPFKVLVQVDDILTPPSLGEGHPSIGAGATRIASMAVGLNEVFVLQASAAQLYRLRERVLRGFEYPGTALFSVYSGAGGDARGLHPYLIGAAATEARLFPSFTFDPAAGRDLASRYSLDENPQAERDWPAATLVFEDADHRRLDEPTAFTLVDFVASDSRYARHFARVPAVHWNGAMVPVGDWLEREDKSLRDKVPYVAVIDRDDRLHRLIVDEAMIAAARRCRELWHGLQEMGGIRNSYAERLLARERKAWEEGKQREIEAIRRESRASAPAPGAPAAEAAPAAPAASPAPAAAPAPAPAPAADTRSDAPYIETPRCTSCNECTRINNKMFAYDGNKQAFIADPAAGSYRQLVEAAESCQVAIIHPGKPRDPDEPGLDELVKRAEPFQ